jgi:hypothetical protein
MNTNETILATLPGSSDAERLLMVLCSATESTASHVELRQQSFAPGLGWFNQATIALEPAQVSALRLALGTGNAARSNSLPQSFRRVEPTTWQPKVVHADSA